MEKAEAIVNSGWHKSMRKGNTGIGYTFETLVGVKENNSTAPDFGHIEIKTSRAQSKSMISLFTYSPKNTANVMPTMHNRFGTVDKRGYKTLYSTIKGNRFNTYKKKRNFRVFVERDSEQILIGTKPIGDDEVEYIGQYTFDEIREQAKKINTLAFVRASVKKSTEGESFKYQTPTLLKFRGIETFLSLIESGKIAIDVRIGVYKSGAREGLAHDHGTAFRIKPSDLHLLYDEIEL